MTVLQGFHFFFMEYMKSIVSLENMSKYLLKSFLFPVLISSMQITYRNMQQQQHQQQQQNKERKFSNMIYQSHNINCK